MVSAPSASPSPSRRPNLEQSRADAVAEIGPERERIWRLYLTAAALGFEEADITVYQLLVARRGALHGLALQRPGFLADPRVDAPVLPVAE